MAANRLEAFETVVINRAEINKADYNPRKISADAEKKLRRFLRENGLWSPLVVNRQTMTLVSGHQRLNAMDMVLRKEDYDLTVAMVDVDEETEIKGNVFLNNPSAQGEWDIMALGSLRDIVPDLDYVKDLGFDFSEVSVMFGDGFLPKKEEGEESEGITVEEARELKKQQRDKAREQNSDDGSYHAESADYTVTIVFPNNREKREFMKKIRKPETEKHIKHTVLHDIASGAIDILL
jgi:ParB-like chromosome segregation protein Spo0J